MKPTENIFNLPNFLPPEELITILVEKAEKSETKNIRIERIVSTGQVSDWYDQTETEFVLLLSGRATIEFEDREVALSRGDMIVIQPHERHRVSYTSTEPPCVWLCVFY
ncbi:MAG: cupin domain-containing protein [Turicibacter sp.]|nr:cupin domain-containing protein [Turicibacter sp.]